MNTALVLSYETNPDGSLMDQGASRVARSAELYKKGAVDTVTMTGGWRLDLREKGDAPTHAEAMAAYAEELGVPAKDIFQERTSVETVGQFILSARDILVPKNIKDIVVVTHDYHLPRVEEIAEFVLGPEYNISYEGVEPEITTPELLAHGKKSLQAFYDTFEGVPRGDVGALVRRMYQAHKLYHCK